MAKGKLSTAEIQFWISEANSCVERQRLELLQRNNYPFLINYFEGIEKVDIQYPHVSAKQKMAIINEYFPNTNTLIAEIMYQNPDIMIEALKPTAEEDQPLMRAALTYCFNKSDALIENRIALFDMLYAGYCAVEVDFLNPSKEEKPEEKRVEEEEPRSMFDKFKKKLQDAKDVEEAERNFAKLSPQIETNFAIVQGTYFRRYDPLDVPLDWRADRIRDRRYNLKKIWLSKAEFDVKYPKFKDLVNVEEEKFEHSKHASALHNRKVLLFEFQAKFKGNQYRSIIISPHVKTQEIDTFDRPYTTNGFNMKIGTLHKYGKLYPRSFAQVNKRMQDEMNNYVRHMMDVAERNIPKRVYDKNKIKVDGLEALKSKHVNDNIPCDGNTTGVITSLQATNVSFENKELISIFQDQKNKLWAVSESRISGRSQSEFATDMVIQEQGFQSRNVDVQEGLRLLIKEEVETSKDIIATFWDGEIFLKVTGSDKMDWYEPVMIADPNNEGKQIVSNPLSELLTADYSVDIDITSARRKDRTQKLQEMIFYIQQVVQILPILQAQKKTINVEEIQRLSKEFGWNPDKIFIEFKPQEQANVPTAGGETISPEEDAVRQAEAESRLEGGGQVQEQPV